MTVAATGLAKLAVSLSQSGLGLRNAAVWEMHGDAIFQFVSEYPTYDMIEK